MQLIGERIKIPKWICGDTFVVQVRVDAVLPIEDPTEPCFEPQTVRLLDRLQELADAGNITELEKHGTVYLRKSA